MVSLFKDLQKCSPYAQLRNKKLSGSEVTFDRLAWTDPFELTLFSLPDSDNIYCRDREV